MSSCNIALFIPCYIDQFYPQVGIATLELLEKLGVKVDYPMGQTCCGQPLANSGMERETERICRHFIDTFSGYTHIVSPSGSCVLHVKEHFPAPVRNARHKTIADSIYELTEFLSDVLTPGSLKGSFPYRVGLHHSCHGLRGLRNAKSSELAGRPYGKAEHLLRLIPDIKLIDLDRPDECCGFGGTFSIFEEAVSVQMGQDRIEDHLKHEAEIITATDMSCLMHMEGLIRRQALPVRIMHIAEILNQAIQ